MIDEFIYLPITSKIEKLETEKLVLKLLSCEENLKKIAFSCNLSDERIEDIVKRNSIFFTQGKINLKKIRKNIAVWENELKYEIAERSITDTGIGRYDDKFLGLKREKIEKFSRIPDDNPYYEIRKEIAENLLSDSHSSQDISEICGIGKFYVELLADDSYFDRFFSSYYEKYSSEKLCLH